MRPHITAMLIFWDESPEQLYDWAKSVSKLADRIVAADGPFADFEHEQEQSPRDALAALRLGAKTTPVHVLPGREWAGQVEKRDAVLQRCLGMTTDWLFWSDADERVRHCRSQALKQELRRRSDVDGFKVWRFTPPNPDARWQPDATQDERDGGRLAHTRLIRALPGLAVTGVHWLYLGERNGNRLAFTVGELPPGLGDCIRATLAEIPEELLLFEHHQTWRSDQYRERMVDYRTKTLQAQIDLAEP